MEDTSWVDVPKGGIVNGMGYVCHSADDEYTIIYLTLPHQSKHCLCVGKLHQQI